MTKWPFESGDFDENGEIGVNDEYGRHSLKFLATSQMRWQMVYIGYKELINSPQNGHYNLWDKNA